MTPRQRRVLDAIERHWREHRCAPNYVEIAHAAGLHGKSGVVEPVRALIRQGYLERTGEVRRNLRPWTRAEGANLLLAPARRLLESIKDEAVESDRAVVSAAE